jgi:hypothetical protein
MVSSNVYFGVSLLVSILGATFAIPLNEVGSFDASKQRGSKISFPRK